MQTKTWFITGASRGIGAKLARAALDAGENVVASGRSAASITEAFGQQTNLLAVALDVTSEEQAKAAAKSAVERFGQIDVLVNSAGFGLLGAVEEASAHDVERIFDTNVFGVLAVVRAVLPQMRRQRSGHILNFSSIGGYRGSAGFGVYCSSKFAVEGLSEALALELAPLGIQVSVIEPGYFRTDFLDARSLSVSPASISDYNETPAGKTRERARVMNHNQPGDPEKLVIALRKIAGVPGAPIRLPLGSDAVAAIEAKNRSVAEELARWRELSVSTDFTT